MSEKNPKTQAEKDAYVLDLALKSMKENMHKKGGVMIEKKSRRFNEMVKQMEAAKSQAEKGIELSGSSKKMVDSIRNYINGGTGIAGGKKEPAAFKESMTVMKHFTTENEFGSYCREINQAQSAESVKSKRHVDPASFDAARLNGEAKTAKEWFLQSKKELSKGLTMDGCATCAAVTELSKGNPNRVISKQDLALLKSKLLQPGSAFRKTMDDSAAVGKFSALAEKGKVIELGNVTVKAARAHSVRAAQYQINQSTAALAKGSTDPKKSAQHLSNILAARELAMSPSAGSQITKDAFNQRAQSLAKEPKFAAFSGRYERDSGFRGAINSSLAADNSATGLTMAYRQAEKQAPAAGLSI
ncbi:MAG: hypothetical protein IJM83_05250 [Firmicutes bacterium]|nr:hypothetical protein [Bacillota bacterium]